MNNLIDNYETISKKKVENIDFFMIFVNFPNFLIMYNGLIGPEITGEDDYDILFFKITTLR